ncbi:DsbE family thiol:disulfide interchange protein [Rhizobium sp. TH2]|uniref:DsbE family thiol:disulfide interchange protein n=1 Tax=Rhizobium sp. TH2 TaxID=2775403 RepID=UPI00215885D6|nr:DsbE family thiol:disulfide interchange protein [Rhizobium sp. TH2]UVC08205.1 DsbE family thiol:disulfide interchange protein [Rhizobium sp. TH2]
MTDATPTPPRKSRRLIIAFLPLAIFGALVAVFLFQLMSGKNNSVIPSALIGKPAPVLALAPLEGAIRAGQSVPALDTAAVKGKLTLVNVWASWCIPCRQEHPIILGLSQDPRINVVGINYKDRNDNALAFLGELGNPFRAIGVDPKGTAAIDWGVYGIPESFLVSPEGVILYKHVGPFTDDSVKNQLLPKIEEALDAAKS